MKAREVRFPTVPIDDVPRCRYCGSDYVMSEEEGAGSGDVEMEEVEPGRWHATGSAPSGGPEEWDTVGFTCHACGASAEDACDLLALPEGGAWIERAAVKPEAFSARVSPTWEVVERFHEDDDASPPTRLHATLTVSGVRFHLTALRVKPADLDGIQRAYDDSHESELGRLYELEQNGDPFETAEALGGIPGPWVLYGAPAT